MFYFYITVSLEWLWTRIIDIDGNLSGVHKNKLWYHKYLLFNTTMSGFQLSLQINSTFFKSAVSLVNGLIVLVKLTHDDKLQSQDALL